MSRGRLILEAFLKGRFSLFLITMAAMFFIMPLVEKDQGVLDRVLSWLSIAVLLSCLRAISSSRKSFLTMAVLTLINVGLTGHDIISSYESVPASIAVLVFQALYFILVFISIMRFVLKDSAVTADKIYGAISAFLLLGIIWSFIYSAFYIYDPASINVPEAWITDETGNSFWAVYFSFTTLTTLGYGDISPQTPSAQAYAVMQAVFGQIFLTVIIARLIALHISHERDRRAEISKAD